MKNQNRKYLQALIIFAMVLIGYGYFSSHSDDNVNSRLALVKAVVDEGRFEIDSYEGRDGLFYTHDRSYYNGHYYSDKAIGASLLGIVAYYPIRWVYANSDVPLKVGRFRELVTFFAISLPTALLAPLLYLMLSGMTGSAGRSALVTLSMCFGTPLFKYSTAYYGHTLAAALFFFAFYIWYHQKRTKTLSPFLTFGSGFILGFLIITEYPTVLLVLILSAYILYVFKQTSRLGDWKIFVLLAGGFVLPVSIQLFYNYACFGNPFTVSYTQEALGEFRDAHQAGLFGIGLPDFSVIFKMTFHPAMGIFWQSPILLMALPGWFVLLRSREYRVEGIFVMVTILVYVVLISGYYAWSGAYTPRHIIPILPLFGLPMAFMPRKLILFALLAACLSVFQHLIPAASGPGLFKDHQDGMTIYEMYLPKFMANQLTNNRGAQWFGLSGKASLIPLFFVEFLLGSLLVAFTTYRKKNPQNVIS